MIRKLKLCEVQGTDPYRNLAIEQVLLESQEAGCCTLYLWQNQNTVVIGSNQNAWKECRTELLSQEGGRLARRLSGGGAVFHDLGNLNFTFLVPSEDYDLPRQLAVICGACRALGIPAEVSGRNDLLADGKKFSGNAFYHSGGKSYHHGTLLVNVDMEKLGRYLRPSEAKLRAKGVASVRSRVCNLRELCPDLTIERLKQALAQSFGAVYGLPVERIAEDALDAAEIDRLQARNASWEWNYGCKLPFDFSCEARFDWGEMRIELQVESGTVVRAAVYTDAMDHTAAPLLEQALTDSRFSLAELQARVQASGFAQAADVCELLKQQDL